VRVAYAGIETLTFNQYIDLDTGKTLTAEPGGVYDITPASGHTVDDVPGPWFTAAEPLALEAGELDFAAGPAEDFAPGVENPEG
jgi:hypothetical protein